MKRKPKKENKDDRCVKLFIKRNGEEITAEIPFGYTVCYRPANCKLNKR